MQHEKAKEQKAREIETELVHSARDEWMRRLSENNLRAEDWDDMSVAETRAVEKLLGDRYEDTTPLAAPAPAAAGAACWAPAGALGAAGLAAPSAPRSPSFRTMRIAFHASYRIHMLSSRPNRGRFDGEKK